MTWRAGCGPAPGVRHKRRVRVTAIDTTGSSDTFRRGELSEWSKVLDSKSSVPPKGTAGSNPALSARRLPVIDKIRTIMAVRVAVRRGDRAVEGARLEIVCARKGTGGSNPFLSAGSIGSPRVRASTDAGASGGTHASRAAYEFFSRRNRLASCELSPQRLRFACGANVPRVVVPPTKTR